MHDNALEILTMQLKNHGEGEILCIGGGINQGNRGATGRGLGVDGREKAPV